MIKLNAKHLLLFCIGWYLLLDPVWAQLRQPAPQATEILSAIRKLNVLGSVLYFAAHPDDENTRLIAWLANEKKFRTSYLSLTRGDGGQNLIGTELAEELGLIRTQELLMARQLDGGEQYFSRANDFGFSKTPEETLAFWGKEPVLADAVWIIRKLRPDVIITRFPADPRGGHGHHQAATQLAIEAFSAAADPSRFPEQLDHGVAPWQATRLLWNTANFGGQNNTSPDQYNVDIGDYNPLIGKSYGEIAAESRSSHKSQGFGAARQRGSTREFFETLGGSAPNTDLMEGVNTTWSRVEGAGLIPALITAIEKKFDVTHPERVLPDLLHLLGSMELLPDGYWKEQKIKELKDIILACAGIWFESYAANPKYASGDKVTTQTDFIVRRPGVNVEIHRVSYHVPRAGTVTVTRANDAGDGDGEGTLAFNTLFSLPGSFIAGPPTQPYWLRQPRTNELYTVADMEDIGEPGNRDDPYAIIELTINGNPISYRRPIVYKYTHPVHGEVYQPLSIAPAITANIHEKALVFANGTERELDVVFTSHSATAQQATVTPRVPSGWRIVPERIELSFGREHEEVTHRIVLKPTEERPAEDGSLEFLIHLDGSDERARELARMIRTIDHPHIPLLTYYPTANVKLSQVNGEIPIRRIGYIPGAGDLVPDALRQIGIEVELLEEKDIIGQDLSRYDAIVSGVRAYNVNPRISHIHSRLMDYVAQGGTYLVQYNVNTRLQTDQLGPRPFGLSRLRVTDELAPVRFTLPEHQVLNYPNQITEADFKGWVQERGLYFAVNVDPTYQKPLSMNDPGEQPLDGSLLVASYGEGKFVYTSLAFFRQLPAGVPGAYRLFINLISKPEHKE